MTRIRTIKPAFWTSQTLAKASRDARLLFAGLWNEADDEGRLPDSPKGLAGALFPFDEDVDRFWIDARLQELVKVGAVVRYEVDGALFISIPNFLKHQTINKPRPSAIPPPTARGPDGSSTPPVVVPHSARTTTTGNGMEGNGMEEERERAPARRPGPERAQTIFGAEEAKSMPNTPKEVLADSHYGPIIKNKFPAMKPDDLELEIRSDLESFWKRFKAHGRDSAFSGLISWMNRRYAPYERRWREQGGIDVAAITGPAATGPPPRWEEDP